MVYIGYKDQVAREGQAAAEVEYLFKNQEIPEAEKNAQVAQAASKYGVNASRVSERAALQARGTESFGSSVSPSKVRYFKDDKGALTWRTGRAKSPEGYREIDYQTYKAIERSKSGRPLGVEELERIAPSNTEEFRAARQRQELLQKARPTMPSDVFYSVKQRQADLAQRQREQELIRSGGQVSDVIFSKKAYAYAQVMPQPQGQGTDPGILKKIARITEEGSKEPPSLYFDIYRPKTEIVEQGTWTADPDKPDIFDLFKKPSETLSRTKTAYKNLGSLKATGSFITESGKELSKSLLGYGRGFVKPFYAMTPKYEVMPHPQ